MTVYLRKQLINDTPTTKVEVFNFCSSSFLGAKKIETKTEPNWWQNFKTEQEALESCT